MASLINGAAPEDAPNRPGASLLNRIAANPVGTETTQSMGMQRGPFDELRALPAGGAPVMQSDLDAAHARVAQAMELAPTLALGMTGNAPGMKGLPIKPASESVGRAMDATFTHGKDMGPSTMPIDKVSGGVAMDNPEAAARVAALKDRMSGEGGYISRLIVDQDGNVIEGQHRLEALRQMGAKDVPVHVVKDLAAGVDEAALNDAVRAAQPMHSDQRHQLVGDLFEAIHDVGSVAEVRQQYEAPRGYEKAWNAALDHLDPPPVSR